MKEYYRPFGIHAEGFDARVRDLSELGQQIERAQVQVVNKVARKVMTESRREIVSRVNLTDSYVRARMRFEAAVPGRAMAVIRARERATRLATYGAVQVTRAAPRAKGDARRRIAPGHAQAGVAVAVRRGRAPGHMPGGFFMPLKAGEKRGGNGMGVFLRHGKGARDMTHRYGYGVARLFAYVLRDTREDIAAELRALFEGHPVLKKFGGRP